MKYHKNGVARDIEKMLVEGRKVKEGLAPHWKRFSRDVNGHSYTNLPVEAARISPYFVGHIDAVVWPGFIISVILNLWFIFS